MDGQTDGYMMTAYTTLALSHALKMPVDCMYRIFMQKVQMEKASLKCDSLVCALLSSVIFN